MKSRINNKLILAVSAFLLAASQSNLVMAANGPYSEPVAPDGPYSNQPAPNGYNQGYQNYPPQGTQGYGPYTNMAPRYAPPPYRNRNYDSGPSFSGPWNNNRGNSMPWGNNRGRSMPWDNRGGGSNMPWDSGRGGWMNKDRFSDGWDDMLNAPGDMGEMPGGFTAPSVSVPNPVDVGDEFQDAARDAPDQMRNVYDDNRQSR